MSEGDQPNHSETLDTSTGNQSLITSLNNQEKTSTSQTLDPEPGSAIEPETGYQAIETDQNKPGTSETSDRDSATGNQNSVSSLSDQNWNFEEKNPFSEFSEEHLNKLDEVLQSEEVRELLKQSTTSDLDLLNMDLGENGGENMATEEDDQAVDELPESIMSAVFSDHGYCMNPERGQKPKNPDDSKSKVTPVMVNLDEEGNLSPVVDLAADLFPLVPINPDVAAHVKPLSPYVNSPRKSGRAPTRNRMFDEEWVTESPGRNRGRGKSDRDSSPGFGSKRSSTRISDQKQRDLAEKILQANRQAMEAEKQDGDTPPTEQNRTGKGRGKKEAEEDASPVGKGKKGKQKGLKVNKEDIEEDRSEEDEIEETEKEADQKKTKKAGKRYEDDSDFTDEEKKSNKNKKKGKKKGKKEEKEESEEDESEEKEKKVKEIKGKKGKLSLKTLKTKKKEMLKGKNVLKKKTRLGNDKTEETEETDSDRSMVESDTEKNSSKSKGLKKLTKKDRLKKLKASKISKKAKLLERKKAKAKLKKGGKVLTAAKSSNSSTTGSPGKSKLAEKEGTSPVGKKTKQSTEEEHTKSSVGKKSKQSTEEEHTKSPVGKKSKLAGVSPVTSPVKKKNVSPKGAKKGDGAAGKITRQTLVNKRKEATSPVKSESPTKKQKLAKKGDKGVKNKVKSKREVSDDDSDDDIPLKKIKTDKPNNSSQPSEMNKSPNISVKAKKAALKIFSALGDSVAGAVNKLKTDKSESKVKEISVVDDDTESVINEKSNNFQSSVRDSNTQSVAIAVTDNTADIDKNDKTVIDKKSNTETKPDKSGSVKMDDKSKKGSDKNGVQKSQDESIVKDVESKNKTNKDKVVSNKTGSQTESPEGTERFSSHGGEKGTETFSSQGGEKGNDKEGEKSKDSNESHRRHDSLDSKDSRDSNKHHHHSHRHNSSGSNSGSSSRRHSHDRRESETDRKDSSSHRRHSHDHKDSHDRKSSSKDRRDSSSSSIKDKDRRDSKSEREKHDSKSDKGRHNSKSERDKHSNKSDKDRHSKEGKDQNKPDGKERKDSHDSTSGSSVVTPGKKTQVLDKGKLGSASKKLNKDSKGKVKKVKREDPMDQSMVDLFKPDNDSTKEEVKAEKVDNEKVTGVKHSKVRFSFESDDIKADIKEENEHGKVLKEVGDLPEVKTQIVQKDETKAVDETENELINVTDDIDVVEEDSKMEIKVDIIKSGTEKPEVDEGVKVDLISKQTEVKTDVNKVAESDQIENKSDIKEVTEMKSGDAEDIRDESVCVKDKPNIQETDKASLNGSENTAIKVSDDTSNKISENVIPLTETDGKETIPDDRSNLDKVEEKTEVVVEANKGSDIDKNKATSSSANILNQKPDSEKSPKKVKKVFNIADFFKEKRLKINDPKPRKPKVAPVEEEEYEIAIADPDTPTRQSSRRNKGVAFAEILKKEKMGSDEEEEEQDDADDDDDDFEDPNKLYCICRQPHNQRFMICCDSCEGWFHGKCVGITRAQGAEMEKNNEDYICPDCRNKDGQVSTTDAALQQESSDTPTDSTNEKSSVLETVTSLSVPDSTEGSRTAIKPNVQDNIDVSSTVKTPTKHIPVKHAGSESKPSSHVKKKEGDLSEKRNRVIKMFKEGDSPRSDKPRVMLCVQCNIRPVKQGSRFCSGQCQVKHTKEAQKPVGILKVTYTKPKSSEKKTKEKHIAVVEKSTGKTLTGEKAPTERQLAEWLKENPSFEVLKVHRIPTPSKPADHKSTHHSKTGKSEDLESGHEGPEPVRLNVRKGLRDSLTARADGADDIMLSNSEIKNLSLRIERELYHYFKDVDAKYKAKYRSLVFNIKDVKNKGLFRKILNGRIRPSKLVRMSADELASKELAQWREQETKHTIEMIKQVETELLKEPVQLTKKTHKGEVEVEGDGGLDMSTLGQQESKKETPRSEEKTDVLSDLLPDTTERHGYHLFDSNCKICTGKVVPGLDSTPSSKNVKTEITPKIKEKDESLMTKQEKDLQAEEVVKEVLKAIQRAKEEAQRDEREFKLGGKTVTVRSPDSALSSGLDKKEKFTPSGPMLWKGFIYMQDVSKFVTTAYIITGPSGNLTLPDTITVCGRINPEHVWDYLSKVKQAASRDISVVRFIPGANEEKVAYINLYSYLNSRSRCGVVEHKAKHIKDFYVVPLASHSKIPSVLLPFDGPGLEENRCHMLIGVIIRNKVKSSTGNSSLSHSSRHKKDFKPLKSALKDPTKTAAKKKQENSSNEVVESAGDTSDKSSSSSTPKTASSSDSVREKKTTTISFDPIVKEYSNFSEQDEPYIPGGDDDPLDLDAPYDPEKEAELKPAEKKDKGKSETAVSMMIEKIASSKNPAEATAAMVTALATTSRLGNQRKLLVELTKKVDEQKRLLEKKRKVGKSSPSPLASPSVAPKGSKEDSKKSLSSKDPRLRAMAAVESKGESGSEEVSVTEPMDVDMRYKTQHGIIMPPALTSDPRLKPNKPFDGHSGDGDNSKTDSSTSLAGGENERTKKETQDKFVKPKGFYVDQEPSKTEVIVPSDKLKKTDLESVNKKGDSKVKTSTAASKVNENQPKQSTSSVSTTKQSEEVSKTNSVAIDIVSQLKAAVMAKSKAVEATTEEKPSTKKDSVAEKPPETKDVEASDVISQIQAEVQGPIKPVGQSEVPNVTSLLKGLGTSTTTSHTPSGQNLLNLPSALISLFSKLPNQTGESEQQIPGFEESETDVPSSSEPQDVDLRGQTMSGDAEDVDLRGEGGTGDTDLRGQAVAGDVDLREKSVIGDVDLRENTGGSGIPGFISTFTSIDKSDKDKGGTGNNSVPSSDKTSTEMEKPSKSFMGFDYDSDSDSGESFEGFDDDGTKVLSPRKRKLVEKRSTKIKMADFGAANEMGDIDSRGNVPAIDVDLRKHSSGPEIIDQDMRSEQSGLNVYGRLSGPVHGDTGRPPIDTPQGLPPQIPLDVDHRRPPLPPPHSLGHPFGAPGCQPPPPGEEWPTSQSLPPPCPPGFTPLPPVTLPPSLLAQPPNINPPLPPLPAEPPAPKPPEPPTKKEKKNRESEFESLEDKDSRSEVKLEKKELLPSDERLQKIVLEIAKKAPIDPPPVPPSGLRSRSHNNSRRFPRPAVLPTPPIPPMSTQGMSAGPPIHPGMPWTEGVRMSGWMHHGPPGSGGLNSQSPMMPPQVPPNMQPGVCFPPPPKPANTSNLPSLLDLPVRMPTQPNIEMPKLTEVTGPSGDTDKEVVQPPHSQDDNSLNQPQPPKIDSPRSREHEDRDERRRRDREHRHRSSDRDSSDRKSRDYRSHSRERDRSRSDRRDRDRNRDRDRRSRDRDRDRRSRDRDYDRHSNHSKHRH